MTKKWRAWHLKAQEGEWVLSGGVYPSKDAATTARGPWGSLRTVAQPDGDYTPPPTSAKDKQRILIAQTTMALYDP